MITQDVVSCLDPKELLEIMTKPASEPDSLEIKTLPVIDSCFEDQQARPRAPLRVWR